MSITKSRMNQIIKEEIGRMTEMAMSPAERSARRRAAAAARAEAEAEAARQRRQKFEPRSLGLVGRTSGPLSSPDMMGYQQYTGRSKAAYIEPGFQQEAGIYTVEDVVQAVRDGTAMIWTAGAIGGGVYPAYTVVPAGAEKSYNAMTGEAGYPYVYNDYEKDPVTGKTNWSGGVEATVYTGAGSPGSLGGPRVWPPRGSESILGNVKAYFDDLVALPLLTMKKEEAEEAAEEMSGEGDEFEEGDMGQHERVPGGEQFLAALARDEDMYETQMNESARHVVGRWNKLAGLMTEGRKSRLNEFKWPWEEYEETPVTAKLETACAVLRNDMVSRARGKPGFNPEALVVELAGDDSSSAGVMMRVWFKTGDFPVVGIGRPGVFSSEAELKSTVEGIVHRGGIDVTNVESGLVDNDPDAGVSTYGWKIRFYVA